MTASERKKLITGLEDEYYNNLRDKLLATTQDFNAADRQFRTIQEDTNLRCLQNANVIGITTSGLARHLSLL